MLTVLWLLEIGGRSSSTIGRPLLQVLGRGLLPLLAAVPLAARGLLLLFAVALLDGWSPPMTVLRLREMVVAVPLHPAFVF